MSRFDAFLVLLGLLAAVCLSPLGYIVGIFAFISLIGIPIALLIGAIPAVFLVLLSVRLAKAVLPVPGQAGWALSAVIGVGLLAIPAYLANARLDATAAALTQGDRTMAISPDPTATLALVRESGFGKEAACSDFCQRALLNGVATTVVAAGHDQPDMALETLAGTGYRFERRSNCPAVDLKDGIDQLDLPGEKRAYGDPKPSDLIRLRIAGGECLIAEAASVGRADAVIAYGKIRKGKSDYAAGLDIYADTVSANRVSYLRRRDGKLEETYRRTWVWYDRLFPVLTLSWIMGGGFDATPGFLRASAYGGSARRHETEASLTALIVALGYDLALRDEATRQETREAIVAALNGPQPVDRANAKVMEDFYEAIRSGRNKTMEDAELALRILENPTVPVPRDASAPVRKFADGNAGYAARFARVAFARLDMAATERAGGANDLAYLAQAIEILPDDAVLPYRANLEKLAHDPERRVRAWQALKRLAVFGAEAVPTLIWLIDDADRYAEVKHGQKRRDREGWQHAYRAGVGGLCAMGPEGAGAIPALLERLEAGTVVKFGSYWRQMVHTLISLGAEPEEMWPYLQTGDKNHTRERFDAEIKRARRKVECHF